MINLVRVDHRLIHGQVAFSWTKFSGIDAILIPSDTIVHDELRMNLLRMARPKSVKLIIKDFDESIAALNSNVTDKYRMMILLESIEEAHRLFKAVPSLKELNLGGTKTEDNKRQISKAVHITDDEEKLIRELVEDGVEVSVQMVPEDTKEKVEDLL